MYLLTYLFIVIIVIIVTIISVIIIILIIIINVLNMKNLQHFVYAYVPLQLQRVFSCVLCVFLSVFCHYYIIYAYIFICYIRIICFFTSSEFLFCCYRASSCERVLIWRSDYMHQDSPPGTQGRQPGQTPGERLVEYGLKTHRDLLARQSFSWASLYWHMHKQNRGVRFHPFTSRVGTGLMGT